MNLLYTWLKQLRHKVGLTLWSLPADQIESELWWALLEALTELTICCERLAADGRIRKHEFWFFIHLDELLRTL